MNRRTLLLLTIVVLLSGAAMGALPNTTEPAPSPDGLRRVGEPGPLPFPPGERIPSNVQQICSVKGPDIKAPSAILVDACTGQVLYARKPHYRRPIASTTKIMTALLVLEHCDLDDTVTASKAASKVPYSSLHLMPGEKLSVRDMLIGMLLRSANDAAYAFAEHISGSVSRFVRLMNERAKALGMKDTHFKNPNGLYIPGHYSTAYDLALLARAAIKHPVFNEIVSMRSATISRSRNTKDLLVLTRSPFLRDYPGADGIKSGYTKEAGYCFVGSATRGGWRLISVVLKSDNASRDTMALMDYGFQNFEQVVLAPREARYRIHVAGGTKPEIYALPAESIAVAVARGRSRDAYIRMHAEGVIAPVKSGQRIGQIVAYVGGRPVHSASLLAAEDVDRTLCLSLWLHIRWPAAAGVLAAAIIGSRRLMRGRSPAKNTLRRRRGFSPAGRRIDPTG